MKNQLSYGDNLDVLRDRIADESVDLMYLDPPINSNRNYYVLFKEKSGEDSASQIGAFTDLAVAQALFNADPLQFEWWALSLVRAMPGNEKKKGADKRMDGIIRFHVDNSGKAKKAIVQVKGGKVQAPVIRDLRGTMIREKADMAILVTLQKPSSAMIHEAANAGGTVYPAIQIMTVEELLDGREPRLPHAQHTFQRATKISRNRQPQLALGGMSVEDEP